MYRADEENSKKKNNFWLTTWTWNWVRELKWAVKLFAAIIENTKMKRIELNRR